MKLSARSKDYLVPEYSLTGDLLSFLTCALQYRYQNKGTLPPSTPIQLWFGEFIHGTMEEAFLKWDNLENKEDLSFPWDWKKDIRPIEEMIDKRLQSRGLYPPLERYCYHNQPIEKAYSCPDNQHPHKLLYSARAEAAINVWGSHLFPLIDNTELLIKGIRDMPNQEDPNCRSKYYTINGIVDVLSSIKIDEIASLTQNNSDNNLNSNFQSNLDSFVYSNSNNISSINSKSNSNSTLDSNSSSTQNSNTKNISKNKILEYLANDKSFRKTLKSLENNEYEIIIDYKGMKRPSLDNENYKHHEWQILTYSWLRELQTDIKPIAGIIFYLNELVPSTDDLTAIQKDYRFNKEDKVNTDVPISDNDLDILLNWDSSSDLHILNDLSDKFKIDRSIRIISINKDSIEYSLKEFDKVVNKIETATIKEISGTPIRQSWNANGEERTCSACDFRNFCNKNENMFKDITVP